VLVQVDVIPTAKWGRTVRTFVLADFVLNGGKFLSQLLVLRANIPEQINLCHAEVYRYNYEPPTRTLQPGGVPPTMDAIYQPRVDCVKDPSG